MNLYLVHENFKSLFAEIAIAWADYNLLSNTWIAKYLCISRHKICDSEFCKCDLDCFL